MVRVSVEPARAEVGLGSAVSIEVRVFNASEIVDHFAVSALGVDPAWVSVDVERAQLEPGGEATVRLLIEVPESANLPAGEHVIGIRVASLSDPGQSAVEEVRLDVGAETDIGLALQPSQLRASRSGRANLRIDNRGNRPVDMEFHGSDPEMVMHFSFTPPRLEVPAFADRDSVLGIRLPRLWVGRPVTRTFTVEGRHADGLVAASGTLVQRAVLAPWLVRALTTAIGVALIAVIAIVVSGTLGEDSTASDQITTVVVTTVPPTPTSAGPEEDTPADDPTTTTPTTVPMVQIADLLGLSVAEAQAWADGQGLDLSVSAEFANVTADSGLAGRVAAQSIAPGAEITSGSSISVSLGVVRLVQIPDVTGLGEAEAMQVLNQAGLVGRIDGTVSVNPLSGLGGVIAEQTPEAGADLEQGSIVSLLVGRVESGIVNDPRLLASYPLTGDGLDVTGKNGEATLLNVTFAEGGLYCHGVHRNMDPSGCEILTPTLADFNFDQFSVHIEFRPTLPQSGPVVVGGTSHRWIGFLLNEDGTTSLLYNNSGRQQCNEGVRYQSNEWHDAVLTYKGVTAQLFLDGTLACQVDFDLDHSSDANFGTGNYSSGRVFEGWVRGLRIYSEVVPPAVG